MAINVLIIFKYQLMNINCISKIKIFFEKNGRTNQDENRQS